MADPAPPVWTPQNPAEARMMAAAASGVYLRIDDNVRVTSFNAAAGVTLAVRTRMVDLAGYIQAANDPQTPNTDRTAKATIVASDEGWLLGGAVFVTAGTPLEGQCFVVVEIVRGQGAAALALEQIAAGYVTAKQPLRFPSLSLIRSLDGAGALRSITGATPGAGAEISETVPTGARWELIAFSTQLVTSVAAGVRRPQLTLDDGANVFYRLSHTAGHAANVTFRHEWFAGSPEVAADLNANLTIPLPIGIKLGAGYRIKTVTVNIDVADQWSLVQYLVREWLEGA